MNQPVGNHAIREIFTDSEWNLLYDALSEFQDHEESYDEVHSLMNKISSFFIVK